MDDAARYLATRWKALGEADAVFGRPWTDIDAATARSRLDPEHRLGDLNGKDVLCLAGGGGQQSIGFAVLGADVTVLDFDERQLRQDWEVSVARRHPIATCRGDMRSLPFDAESFDVVWQPYSMNFVREADRVIDEVARVSRRDATYVLMMANPFAVGIGTIDWNGEGYVLKRPYVDGAVHEYRDEEWVSSGDAHVPAPRDYVHRLGTIVRHLADVGFVIVRVDEAVGRTDAPPGSWEHLCSIIPPWVTFWSELRCPAPNTVPASGSSR
jgi:ubiquinone/menaquinone biosynthesis C-methylase UbiE